MLPIIVAITVVFYNVNVILFINLYDSQNKIFKTNNNCTYNAL